MTTRDNLHILIDELPESSFDNAGRVLTELRDDPWAWLHRYAEIDDEVYSEEEKAWLDERFERAKTARLVPHEEVERMLDALCAELSPGQTTLSATS